jgi:hypothetical protein
MEISPRTDKLDKIGQLTTNYADCKTKSSERTLLKPWSLPVEYDDQEENRIPRKKATLRSEVRTGLKLRGQQYFAELFEISTPRQNRIEILITGKPTFFFLIPVGSNPQVQLEKCTF